MHGPILYPIPIPAIANSPCWTFMDKPYPFPSSQLSSLFAELDARNLGSNYALA
jgi:hypothetical protein